MEITERTAIFISKATRYKLKVAAAEAGMTYDEFINHLMG